MATPANSDVTLLTEHLTYRPIVIIDDIVNSINILSFQATEAVENGLFGAQPADLGFRIPATATPEEEAAIQESVRSEIENGVHKLETLLEAKIDKNFDKLEVYALRNILSVPPEIRDWVRLSHYEGLNFTIDEDAPTVESITAQRKRVRETQKLHALLLAETAMNDATLAALKPLLGTKPEVSRADVEAEPAYPTFAFLQNKGDLTGDVKRPVTTTTSFALSQLSPLREITTNLRLRLEELTVGKAKAGLVGEEEKSWRKERREFVESETRRHLENVRGLELGEMGEVRDGEWQGEGRKLGKQEVEDLEKVVGMVAGNTEKREEEGS